MRQQSKVTHSLPSLLLHAIMATLCGCRGPTAMAQWGRLHPELVREMAYPSGTMPCAATFCRVFARLDWHSLVTAMGEWAEAWLQREEPAAERSLERSSVLQGLAVDGKTLRGSRKRGGKDCHTLTTLTHGLGLTLGESAVDDRTNEIPVAVALLQRWLGICRS
ncbi:transposase family protein [Candidatus Poribacteria bacterium]|nr:transposase family protein [Candidatus Poribacteria bacterium]